MARREVWSNVKVFMESALGADIFVSAITKADPGVFSAAGHGLTTGDYVRTEIEGMLQIDERVYRVIVIDIDTFKLERVDGLDGIDTTEYDDFVSGKVNKVTFGTTISTILNLTGSGGEAKEIDFTTISDDQDIVEYGNRSAITYSITNRRDITDAGLLALQKASELKQQKAIMFKYATGSRYVFLGRVNYSNVPTGNAQDRVESAGNIALTRPGVDYLS